METINLSQLTRKEDGIHFLGEVRFSGFAVETFPDGQLKTQMALMHGVQDGVARCADFRIAAVPSSTVISGPGLIPQCAVTFGANQSGFVVAGLGGTPAEPGSWQPDLDLSPAPGAPSTRIVCR